MLSAVKVEGPNDFFEVTNRAQGRVGIVDVRYAGVTTYDDESKTIGWVVLPRNGPEPDGTVVLAWPESSKRTRPEQEILDEREFPSQSWYGFLLGPGDKIVTEVPSNHELVIVYEAENGEGRDSVRISGQM